MENYFQYKHSSSLIGLERIRKVWLLLHKCRQIRFNVLFALFGLYTYLEMCRF